MRGTNGTSMRTDVENQATAVLALEQKRNDGTYVKEVNKAPRRGRKGRIMVKHNQRGAYYLALLDEIRMLVDYIAADASQPLPRSTSRIRVRPPRKLQSGQSCRGSMKSTRNSSTDRKSQPNALLRLRTQPSSRS
jgi:hypothetical protein